MLNDPLANALSIILNAERIGKKECTIKPSSKIIEKVLEIMKDHHFVGDFEKIESRQGTSLKLNLISNINKCGVIKPRFAVKQDNYEKFEKRFLPAKDFGIIIVSTSQGIMVQKESKEKKIGGKLIAFIY
ncbi:30S ribosomal protein S8 [Candidatus Woesearchaeota archaeon]|nr:30S ribosomal protein S8 [Candidatus Woesearchaeota archaeon]MBL7050595.1 30S ribosomal protein S8 [Candidatus Woesearchaeota archaeon]